MIIDDDKVGRALDYLNEYPHPAARARKDLRLAEIGRDKLHAELFLASAGNVKERESIVQLDKVYLAACKTVADAEEQVENQRARTKAAEMICELYRTEQANIRAAERIR